MPESTRARPKSCWHHMGTMFHSVPASSRTRFGDSFAAALARSNFPLMDQVTPTHALDYGRASAEELGYDREAVAFLGISRLKGVGFQTLFNLGGRSGVAELLEARDVFEIAKRISAAPSGRSSSWDEFSRNIFALGNELADHLTSHRIRFLFGTDPRFPSTLSGLPDELRPPRWLFVAGDLELLERRAFAVVGTRDPAQDGEFLARYAVSCARELDAPVVSGLAHGIDRLVHEWCLHLSVPTISVLGTGILAPYPAKHVPLGNAILAAGGTLLTEYLPTQGPSARARRELRHMRRRTRADRRHAATAATNGHRR